MRVLQKFRHNKIYYDLQKLYKLYWNQHKHLSKAFRFTTGEQILNELTQAIRLSVLANLQGKSRSSHAKAIEYLFELSAILETVESLLILAWELRLLSHGGLALLSEQIGHIQRQVAGWRKWFSLQ